MQYVCWGLVAENFKMHYSLNSTLLAGNFSLEHSGSEISYAAYCQS